MLIVGIKKSFPARTAITAAPGREVFALWAYQFFTRLIKEQAWSLPVQQPPDTSHGALDPLDEVIAGIQLKHRVDSLSQKVGMDRLCVLLNGFQDWIAGFYLLLDFTTI